MINSDILRPYTIEERNPICQQGLRREEKGHRNVSGPADILSKLSYLVTPIDPYLAGEVFATEAADHLLPVFPLSAFRGT